MMHSGSCLDVVGGCLAAIALTLATAGCATTPVDPPADAPPDALPRALAAETVCEFAREAKPEGLSALSRISGNRYYSVDDRGGLLFELEITLNAAEDDGACRVIRKVRLDGRVDLEGCAYDPLDGRVWVSDEHDHSIRQFDPATGRETASVAVPDVFLKWMRKNRSFEALTISPDGLRLYAANEDTLTIDGPAASAATGGLVRVQEFVRRGAGDPWRATRQFRYATEPVAGGTFAGMALSGVAALLAPGDGTLLVLEREMSRKNPLFPSFYARLFAFDLSDAASPVGKRLVWEEDTMFANYEGMAFGPVLKDGTQSLVLVSDGGGPAEERIQVLSLTARQK